MTDAAWVLLAGLILAGAVPLFRFGSKAFARAVANEIAKFLNIPVLQDDVAYIKDQVTINGGETVKDRIALMQEQLSDIQRDLELLFGDR